MMGSDGASAPCQPAAPHDEGKKNKMTLVDLILCATSVCLSGGSIAYTLHLARTNRFEQPTEEQIRHMIDTAPRGRFDAALER